MAKSLAVEYRPRTLEEVVGQRSVIKILNKQLQTESFKHCYLFAGFSGTGKTTIARAFARAINKGIGEPIEIDAASNSGVDNVREIIRQAQERSIEGKYKIFVIDECHSLSNQAWQAFLKCIEEPPTYTIFMFCTTDPQKIPPTIVNRVQRFNLTKIETNLMIDRLKYVCKKENIVYTDEAIDYIAKLSDGGLRDSLTNLEKVVDYGDVTVENALECLGSYSYSMFFELVNSIIDGREDVVLSIINEIYNKGSDLKIFVEQFLNFCLDVSKYAIFRNCNLIKIPTTMENDLQNAVAIENVNNYYMYLVDKLLDLKVTLRNDTNMKDTIEVYFMKMCRFI